MKISDDIHEHIGYAVAPAAQTAAIRKVHDLLAVAHFSAERLQSVQARV